MPHPIELEEQLKGLRDAYANSLPQKLASIHSAWRDLQRQWDVELLRTLYRQVHSLTGSGATFGFAELSSAAREAELYLQEFLENNSAPENERVQQLTALLDEIEHAAGRGAAASPALPAISLPPANADNVESHLVYLIESDPALAQTLLQQLSPFGYVLRVFTQSIFSNDRAILEGIERDAPAAILMDLSEPRQSAAASEWLNKIQPAREIPLPVIVIANHGDLLERVRAARMGAAAYLTKPIEINLLVAHLDMLTSQKAPEPYRILIIEDDVELAQHNALVLQQAGMITRVVTDPMKLLNALIEFNPGLILMDLYMPTITGLELAAVIRQQEAYVSIPIVFLSAVKNPDIQLAAMKLGGDDFLAKPIRADQLVSSVSTRAQRYTALRYFMTRDGLTGLLNHTAIEERLEIEVARSRRVKSTLAYAMIDIDHFKTVNDTYGHPVGDRVLKSLSRLLQQRFRKADAIGRYGGEEFALILPDTDAPTAAKILDEFRVTFGQIRHQADTAQFSITLSAGVASFPPYGDPVRLNAVADKALYAAKHRGRNQVVIAD